MTVQDLSDSYSTMKRMYGEETLKYISYLLKKSTKVCLHILRSKIYELSQFNICAYLKISILNYLN
jgi:hypothetical protein